MSVLGSLHNCSTLNIPQQQNYINLLDLFRDHISAGQLNTEQVHMHVLSLEINCTVLNFVLRVWLNILGNPAYLNNVWFNVGQIELDNCDKKKGKVYLENGLTQSGEECYVKGHGVTRVRSR